MESLFLRHPHNSFLLSNHESERICKSHTLQKVRFSAKRKSLIFSSKDSGNDHRHDTIQSRLKFQGRNNKSFSICGASQPLSNSDFEAKYTYDPWASIWNAALTFYRSIRPYAIIGTAIDVTTSSILAVDKVSDLNVKFLIGLMQAVVPAVLMNIYMVFINNLTDVEIDKVNKPYLAIASGEFSYATGVVITIALCALSLSIGWIVGSRPLLWAVLISLVLGTGYSVDLPFLRWKRNPITAQLTWIPYQTVLLVGYFLHMQTHVLGKPALFPNSMKFAGLIFNLFSVVITAFKDIPDTDGDRKFGVDSFAIRLGQKRVFWLCISLLETAYAIAILVGLMSPFAWSKFILVFGHGLIATILWGKAKAVDLKSKVAVSSFYMFIWKLFYIEHLLVPFVR